MCSSQLVKYSYQALPDALFHRISRHKSSKYIRCLKELYVDFTATESCLFHLNMPNALVDLGSGMRIDDICNGLISLCFTIGETPIIRYSESKCAFDYPKKLASILQSKLEKNYRLVNKPTGRDRSLFLILDRSFDSLAPLVHDFGFQAIAADLLPETRSKYSYSDGGRLKQAVLDDKEPLWVSLRHKHIAECFEILSNEFSKFNSTSDLLKGRDLENLKTAVKGLSRYHESKSQLALFLSLANECLKEINQRQINVLSTLEQKIVTRCHSDGSSVKKPINDLLLLLNNSEIKNIDKLRLILIYAISRDGLRSEHRKKITGACETTSCDYSSTVDKLSFLGCRVEKSKDSKKRFQRPPFPSPFENDRYIPDIVGIAKKLGENTLDEERYPFVRPSAKYSLKISEEKKPTSLRVASPKGTWQANRPSSPSGKEDLTGVLFIFVVGGVSFAEARHLQSLSALIKRKIIVGGTSLLTATDFIENLKMLPPQ